MNKWQLYCRIEDDCSEVGKTFHTMFELQDS
ncbi:hypothetical protein T4C_2040 [Trichinella pseudospiralis]|uniref:Uncharacterized protein n=1 Tax=Trichinella pseudospiralis TaxID=6337 RepID=A0A0V1GA46_TRIPS|nr:hypothetical protein T4C_2040 [Trichinella pseudospiralis]